MAYVARERPLLTRLLMAAGVVGSVLPGCGARTIASDRSYAPSEGGGQGGESGSSGAGGASAGTGGSSAGTAGSSGSAGASGTAGSAGTAGTAGTAGAAVCATQESPPRDSSGQLICDSSGSWGFCDLRCYAPGPTTHVAPCLDAKDPQLQNISGFAFETCGLKAIDSGAYCNEEMEKYGGNTPICCYVTYSEPCPGRPLTVAGRVRYAALVPDFAAQWRIRDENLG